VRFLREFITNYLKKRALVFGSTSVGRNVKKLSFGNKPEIETGFVRPPLADLKAEPSDARTRGVFVNEFWDQIIAAGAGVGGGWIGGHYASLGVKSVVPKWAAVFTRSLWSRSKVADFASPGVLAGFAVTYYLSDKISEGVTRFEFHKRVDAAKNNLTGIAANITSSVAAKNEYGVWLNSEKLKNGLMLQNYLLTKDFTQGLSEESDKAIRLTLADFADCDRSRERIIESQKIKFKTGVRALLQKERINLLAALDVTQAVQEILLAQSDAMTEPLIDTNNNLLLRDRWILDAEQVGEEAWRDITAAVTDVQIECSLAPAEVYP
jgi:hypothetical protein